MGTIRGERTVEIDAPVQRVFESQPTSSARPSGSSRSRTSRCTSATASGARRRVETESDAKVRTIRSRLRFAYEPPTRDHVGPGARRRQGAARLVAAGGPRRRAHARHLWPRGRPRPHARDAAPRPRRGQGARLPGRRRGRGAQGARGGGLRRRCRRPAAPALRGANCIVERCGRMRRSGRAANADAPRSRAQRARRARAGPPLTLPRCPGRARSAAPSAARQTYATRAIPASAQPASSASSPKPSTGPSAPVPCRPPRAAVSAPQARKRAVRS